MSHDSIQPDVRAVVEERQMRQRHALITLTNSVGHARGDLSATLQQITEVAAGALAVGRVGIWRYTDDRSAITCVSLFEVEGQHHSSGHVLSAATYPAYFSALAESNLIDADDARRDPRTSEFADTYLVPFGITAMLNAGIHLQETLGGVLCHEHVGPARHWTTDERTFAVAVANLVSLVLEQQTRRNAEQAQKTAAEENRRLAERLVNTLESITDGFFTLDTSWRFTYANREAERMLQLPRSELVGRSIWEVFASAVGTTFEREYRRAVAQQVTVSFEEFYPPFGEWFEVNAYPSQEGLAVHFRDVTERHVSREAMREQATLLDNARDAIMVRDLHHRILYLNKSAERLYGWSLEDARGRLVTDLLYRDSTAFLAAMQTTLDKGEWIGEIEQITRDGKVVTIESHWSLVRNDHGEPKSVLAINTDVTQRKQLEQQYLRAQRLESLGRLAGGIAHDLNNVLTPIMMSIGMLQEDEQDADRLEVLATIEASASRGAKMVKQVLSYARGFEGRRVEVQVGPLIRELVKIAGETFPRNITIEEQVSADLWTIQADPTQLHQVLLNLCLNARDAMPSGGRLTISAENLLLDDQYAAMNVDARVGPYLAIRVEDTGTGIPKDIIDRIFEPFFTTKELGKGTGWGLPTTMAIVKGHRGFIHVDSAVGVGTRFRLYLPARTTPAAPGVPKVEPTLRRGNGETILVVDDEPSILTIAKRTLEAFGYRVMLASSGAEAVALYEPHRADVAVVITDMIMPGMDGAATIQALCRLDPQVRIIATSGVAGRDVTQPGVMHFLRKPYTASTLIAALTKVLQDPIRHGHS